MDSSFPLAAWYCGLVLLVIFGHFRCWSRPLTGPLTVCCAGVDCAADAGRAPWLKMAISSISSDSGGY